MQDMDAIVLKDICSLAQLVLEDEEKAKAGFLARKAKHHEKQYYVDTKKFTEGRYSLQEITREICLVSRLMPMSRGSPVRSTSTTNCSMNHSRTREACFKANLRYLSTIRKCVTIWQENYRWFFYSHLDFNSKIDSANTIANILGGGAVERPPAAESKSVGSPNTADDMKK